MSAQGDKRSVATDALETLGTAPLDANQKRDAIHLAVEPVTAGEYLKPGDHIRVTDGIAYKTESGKGLGIVDPFLPRKVKTGERFWFVMYPRMVHSLRHVWTHPSFPNEVAAITSPTKEASENWLRAFCSKGDTPSYENLMEIIESGDYDSDYLIIYGSDAHGDIPAELWFHVENVLGRKVNKRPSIFSCSC